MTTDQRENIQAVILKNLEKGNRIIKTVKAAGIHYSTYQDWIDPESPRFNSVFSENVKKAFEHGAKVLEELCLKAIINAGTKGEKPAWQAAAWVLERTQPKKYALSTKIEHSGELKTNFDTNSLTAEEKAVLLKLARKNADKRD